MIRYCFLFLSLFFFYLPLNAGHFSDVNVSCSSLDKEFIENLIEDVQDLEGEQRLLKISNSFLGREAFWQQAKENSKKQKLEKKEELLTVNLNSLDCVTYNEIVLAIYHSEDWQGFISELSQIRYLEGKPSTASRHHFPETDWIPNLVKLQYAEDITESVSSFDPDSLKQTRSIDINKEKFFETFYSVYSDDLKKLYPAKEDRVIKNVSLGYIDFDSMWSPSKASPEEIEAFEIKESELFNQMLALLENQKEDYSDEVKKTIKSIQSQLDKLRREIRLKGAELRPEFIGALPVISIASLVKPTHSIKKSDGSLVTNMLITHHGLVIKKESKLFFRHTSTKRAKKVVDIPFEDYIGNFLVSGSNVDDVTNRRSQWRGLHLMKIH